MSRETIERKCPECGTWNVGPVEKCKACGATLNPETRLKEDEAAREKKRLALPKTKFDELLDSIQQSENLFVRVAYVILKGVWFVYWVVLSFILWIIAVAPG